MRNKKKIQDEIRRLKRRLRTGDSLALDNLAPTYRELGNSRRSFFWWTRAAKSGDADSWLEVGYCYQYGIGVRKDRRAALNAYRKAIRSDSITEYDLEEAQYHLAIALLDGKYSTRHRTWVTQLLRDASCDGDYPQAAELLEQLKSGDTFRICRCRRGLRRALGGKAQCRYHRHR